MLTKEQEQRQAIEILCTDMLVPQDHLLRKIDAAVDFKHIYEIVEDLYCEDNGRPSCDPVVLFKLDMIKHLFGMRYTPYRGLPAVTAWVQLKFAALNLKKFAIHKWMRFLFPFISSIIEATLLIGKVASLTF